MAHKITQNPKNPKAFFVENEATGRVVARRDTMESATAVAKRLDAKNERDIRRIGLDKATVSIHRED